jgi:predicted dehydrogenase
LRRANDVEIPEYANGCFSSVDQAISFLPNIAVICSPASSHIEVAKLLAEVGTHLLIEKPLSTSTLGVHSLLRTCRRKGAVLSIGYNLRFMKSLQCYRNFLLQGYVGKVLSIRCEAGQYLPSWRPGTNYQAGVSAKRELGGGVLLELSHELDYLRWIFGEVKWVRALLSKQSNLEIDVEDTAHLELCFQTELVGQHPVGVVNLDFIRHDAVRTCVAIGENGTLMWNGLTGEVNIYRAGAKSWELLFQNSQERDDSYRAEWVDFMDSVFGNKVPLVSGEDGLRVLEIVEAARNSSSCSGKAHSVERVLLDGGE